MVQQKAQISDREALRITQIGLTRPDLWASEVFGISLWEKQAQILRSVFKNYRTAVRSCSGGGKSFTAALAAECFLYNIKPSTVVTTAPTFRQVAEILWREIHSMHGRAKVYLDGNLTSTGLNIESNWFALGLSTDEPERFQGLHNENILVIADEASGLPVSVYNAIENPMATGNAHLLLIGNPTQQAGDFRDAFESRIYEHINISAFDTPNFTEFGITLDDIRSGEWEKKCGGVELPRPYLITPKWVAERWEEWGEGSYQWQVYVLGDFPETGADSVFKLTDIERSMKRTLLENLKPDFNKKRIDGDKTCALDVARYGEDETVFGTRIGKKILDMVVWGQMDTIYTEGRTIRHVNIEQPQNVIIDSVGVGGGVADALEKEEGFSVIQFNAGSKAVDKERFGNRRAELYFKLARMLEQDEIDLPNDPKLKKELLDVRFYFNRKGQMFIESKEEARARGVNSPGRVDVCTMLLEPVSRRKGGKPNVRCYF